MMYDNEGRTSNSDEAFVVVLKHNDDNTKKFIELCEAQSTMFNGIPKMIMVFMFGMIIEKNIFMYLTELKKH